MCAILDASVAREVFCKNPSAAAKEFKEWISDSRRGCLIVGGKVLQELDKAGARKEITVMKIKGRMQQYDDGEISKREGKFVGKCKSNDPHVLALADLSGARLLYSNDKALHKDFKGLIKNPPGKVYSTLNGGKYSSVHKKLLKSDLCRK